jgi:hypothetical protein
MKNKTTEFSSNFKDWNLIIKGFKKNGNQFGLDQRFQLDDGARIAIAKWNGDEEFNIKIRVNINFYY